MSFLRRDNGDAVGGRQLERVARSERAAGDGECAGLQQACPDCQTAGCGDIRADDRLILVHLFVVLLAMRVIAYRRIDFVGHRGNRDGTTGKELTATLTGCPDRDLRTVQLQVAGSCHLQVAGRDDLAQLMHDGAVFFRVTVYLRPVRAAGLDGVEADVAAGRQVGAAGADLARDVAQVASREYVQRPPRRDGRLVRQQRITAAVLSEVIGLRHRKRFVPDVSPGSQCHRIALDGAALIDDVARGHQYGSTVAAVDHAAPVDDAVRARDRNVVACYQRTVRLQRVRTDMRQIDLGYQHGFGMTVRQHDSLRFQPGDVAGQAADLLGAERYARPQPEFARNGGGIGQQLLIGAVVARVAV